MLIVHSYAVIPVSILLFLGVLPYPGSAAGQLIARELATSDLVVTSDAWRGFEGRWQPALRLWLVGSAVSIGLIANVTFYTHLAQSTGPGQVLGFLLSMVFIAALSLWVLMHLYVYPLVLLMERTELRLVYRNALILVAVYPFSSVLGALVWLGWIALSAATGIFLAGGFLVAATIQHNIFSRLPMVRQTEALGG
jgi:hypothetical protein